MSTAAARELRAETTIDAAPAAVWDTLTDFGRMAEWSPEVLRMVPLGRGELRVGRQYLGLNRRKAIVWPTRNVVAELVPGRTIAWDTRSSGARWIWELTPEGSGTRVVHRRPVPRRLTLLGRVFATVFLGGADHHADELEEGMHQTLARFKESVRA